MLMIDTLVSGNVMLNTLPSHSLTPSFFLFLSVSQHGHSDGRLLAVSPEHLRCHSFSPPDVDRRDGWHHAVPPDCSHVLLMC